jgi:glycosyltransferase involved in cell wall biosynthesis
MIMRVLMVSKALVVGIYQRKLEEIARRGVELLAVLPPSWRDERGEMVLERAHTQGYHLEVLPLVNNGDFHLHYYRGLGRLVESFRPHIVHIDEEPYNLATWQALYHARRMKARSLVFSWQNILRRYPPPFSWGERWALRTIDHLIAGTDSAFAVWRQKNYCGPLTVIPQFGTDEHDFRPLEASQPRPYTIGYFGRLVEEKGVQHLLSAVAGLGGDWRLLILGGGPLRDTLQAQAVRLGIHARVAFEPQVASMQMPAQYHRIDTLVLPSLTRIHWKEQFGRVVVEAMMSGVPVVGSDSAAIPDVIGDAGLVVPEGDADSLRGALARLQADSALRSHLAQQGRARALADFTHARIAAATTTVYEQMMQAR